jgi:hypothetical protein
MPKETLKAHLEALRRELGTARTLDADTREQLVQVAEEIDEVLAAQQPDYASLRERIALAALRFEAAHPRFAGVLNDMTDTLAKLGL